MPYKWDMLIFSHFYVIQIIVFVLETFENFGQAIFFYKVDSFYKTVVKVSLQYSI